METLRIYRRVLKNGPLARLLAGEFVSSIGDWLYLVAMLIVVYEATGSEVLLGIVGAARIVPYIVLSVPAGVIVDRYDRRVILLITDVARGVIMVALAAVVVTGGSVLAIIALSVIATCFSVFFGPAIASYIPALVRDETELGPANTAWASLDNLAFIIGPALAGLLIAVGGLTVAFALNAASFGLIALVLWRLPARGSGRASAEDAEPPSGSPSVTPAPGENPVQTDASVRRYLRPLSGPIVIDVTSSLAGGGLSVLTVVLATRALGAGEEATGYLSAAIGVGGVVGSVLAGVLVLRQLTTPLLVGSFVGGAGLALLGLSRDLAPALIAMALAATGAILVEVIDTTLVQRIVPDNVRGRALGVVQTLSTAAFAAGSLLLPIAAAFLGVDVVLIASGAALAAGAVLGVALLRGVLPEPQPIDPLRARVLRLPIFAGLPPARLEAAARALELVPMAAGQTVIREGDRPDRFYVIASGSVRVTQRDPSTGSDRMLRDMGTDEVFGEIGLLSGIPRTATVTAAGDGVLLALDGPAFLDLVGSGPGLSSRLLDLHRGATASASA